MYCELYYECFDFESLNKEFNIFNQIVDLFNGKNINDCVNDDKYLLCCIRIYKILERMYGFAFILNYINVDDPTIEEALHFVCINNNF